MGSLNGQVVNRGFKHGPQYKFIGRLYLDFVLVEKSKIRYRLIEETFVWHMTRDRIFARNNLHRRPIAS